MGWSKSVQNASLFLRLLLELDGFAGIARELVEIEICVALADISAQIFQQTAHAIGVQNLIAGSFNAVNSDEANDPGNGQKQQGENK